MMDDDIIVTAEKDLRTVFDSAYTVSSIGSQQLFDRAFRTTPQALRDVPGVMVQETAVGHGSPYIRGFTSFRNLFLIDGVRLNMSAFRSGPNQYWNTVDPFSIDRIEVVKGPSSVLYGSDAIGGTVQAFTRGPTEPIADGFRSGGRLLTRFASYDDSVIGRAELDLGYGWDDGQRTGLLLGITGKQFDDLTGGADTGEQPGTGYDEIDLDAKLVHWFDDNWQARFAYQRVEQEDVPRTHRTVDAVPFRGTSIGSDLRREFQQNRRLLYAQLHGVDLGGVFDEVHANISLHTQRETRERERTPSTVGGPNRLEFQGFEVDQFGAYLEFVSETEIGRITFGGEWYHDRVDSFFNDATPGAVLDPADLIQGPVADDAEYDLLAVYVQDEIQFSDRLSANVGVRFNYAEVDANQVRNPVDDSQFSIQDSYSSVVWSARGRYEVVKDEVAIFGGVSTGFRAPNLSDLTRFDTARSNEFEVPSPGLSPELYTQYEIGVKVDTERAAFQASTFYTQILDQITRTPVPGAVAPNPGDVVVASGNLGDGFVAGVELEGQYRVTDSVTAFANFTFLEGMRTTLNNAGTAETREFLTRLMPLTYQAGLRYDDVESGRWWVETRIIRAETADRLSLSDVRDTSRVVAGGTPSYTIWEVAGGVQVTDRTNLALRFENITDVDYRIHGSGQNRPGRGLVLTLETEL